MARPGLAYAPPFRSPQGSTGWWQLHLGGKGWNPVRLYLDDAFSQLLYLHRAHEMVELDWCANWLDDCNTVIDCGANIGWFSAFLCQKLPSVRSVAIEGNEKTAWLCRLIMSQLDLSARVDVLNMVLTDNATARFVVLDRPGREPWQMAKQALASEEGPANSTLDQIIEDRDLMPDLVKIDCEGFEVRILRGATSVLARRHAALVIECNQQALREAGTSPRELFEILRGAGYACYHLASFTRQLPFGVAVDEEFQSPSYNFAAIPTTGPLAAKWDRISEQYAYSSVPWDREARLAAPGFLVGEDQNAELGAALDPRDGQEVGVTRTPGPYLGR